MILLNVGTNCHFSELLTIYVMIKQNGINEASLMDRLRTPNEGINERYLKNWADVADKICCRHT